ncbi:hypothetical protein Pst134EA_013062 [Puccinia striiformis f. sp. tritici]|uniref:hypothetical protein n=1 Tax=Puccinia striiformis f. sp. tritici TaxID=168172 RepID=UPI0020078616|nr:hypothetical protein Pst134EA_013062 [Puccinia striiformis f. sp. tritici]KAH9465169.1 hypothetical protein Pst134EA_013062 [Puccinia striiformis f. sp. tritici]
MTEQPRRSNRLKAKSTTTQSTSTATATSSSTTETNAKKQQQQQQNKNPNWSALITTKSEFISEHLTRRNNQKKQNSDHTNNSSNTGLKKDRKRRKKKNKNTQPASLSHENTNPFTQPTKLISKAAKKKLKKMNQTPLNEAQDTTTKEPPSSKPFVENLDFIRFEDSEEEEEAEEGEIKQNKPSNSTNGANNRRGTKRKIGAIVTEDQADAVRKKKGLIITPWFDRLTWKGRNVQQMLTAEIGSFVAYIQPTHEEHQLREMIIQMIRNVVQDKWPDSDVEPFGSFGTKLYLPAGDIDLVIISQQMMNEQKSRILYKLAPLIRENNIGQEVVVIAKAKVPIIKFKTIFGNINVDISINQSNGIVAMKKVTELLDDICAISHEFVKPKSSNRKNHKDTASSGEKEEIENLHDGEEEEEEEKKITKIVNELGAAKCLILVVKSVLKQRGMNEVYTGGLGSYSIICLVVSFLQLHPKIQRGDIDPNKNLGVLLLEFFELYGKHFNFDRTGISVRKGGYYFVKADRGWVRERQPYLLSIEDPADESNDISGGSHNILSVRSAFSGAFDLLSATLYHRHSIQSSRSEAVHHTHSKSSSRPLLSIPIPKQHQQQSVQDQDQEDDDDDVEVLNSQDPMAQSILGETMGVTKELIENRRKNLKLFYNGTLHRLLNLPTPTPPPPPGQSPKSLPTKNSNKLGNGHPSSKIKKDKVTWIVDENSSKLNLPPNLTSSSSSSILQTQSQNQPI